MVTAIQIISLIGALSTIILGGIAIWLSLYFYRRSHELDNSMRTVLSRIEASSKATEVTSRDVLHPVVETILGVVRESTRTSIDTLGHTFMQRSTAKLTQVLEAQTPEEKEAARQVFIQEMNSLLGMLRHEIGKVGLASELESALPAERFPPVKPPRMPGSPSYNWTRFIRRIRDMEASHRFLSVKWLREKRFSQDSGAQEALQIAIDKSMLLTYYTDNPNNPQFPTLCCKLNRDHRVVGEILQAIAEE